MAAIPTADRLFRIFVSSTFSDLAAEREVLRAKVFAPMSRILTARGFTLQIVDLRWGITDEAAFGHQTLRICLEQVRLCQQRSPRPNFLILAGDRHGWRPPPAVILGADFKTLCEALSRSEQAALCAWYDTDANAVPPVRVLKPRTGGLVDDATWRKPETLLASLVSQALARIPPDLIPPERHPGYQGSASEQEIRIGFLDAPAAETHVFAVRRTIAHLEDLMADPRHREVLRRHVDWQDEAWDRNAWQRQRQLHQLIAARFGAEHRDRLFDCACRCEAAGISTEHLADSTLPAPDTAAATQPRTLAEAVWGGLWPVLLAEMEGRTKTLRRLRSSPGPTHFETALHQASRCLGREAVLDKLARMLEPAGARPVVLHGLSGVGKSTVLSALTANLKRAHPDWSVGPRFIGTGPATANAAALLDGLTPEILPPGTSAESRAAGDSLSVSASAFLRALRAERLAPLVIVLDALDQLPPGDRDRVADWLPRRLPPAVRLVVSTTPGPVLEALRRLWPEAAPNFQELRGLDRSAGAEMLDQILAEDHRSLRADQRKAVLDAFAISQLPLWLDLAGRQARRWPSHLAPRPLPEEVDQLIAEWFDSAAAKPERRLVQRVLGLLAASRRGLTETALWELCSADPALQRDLLGTMHHVPQEIVSQAVAHGMTGDPPTWLARVQSDPAALAQWADRLVEAGVPLPLALWIRISEDLAIYLTEREFFGLGLVDFHHAAVRRVAEQRTAEPPEVHRRMAAYFQARWKQGDLLALDGLARHLALGARETELAHLLSDPDWQVLVLKHLGVGALEEAFTWASHAALDAPTRRDIGWIADAVTDSAHVVAGTRPEGTVGPAAELLPGQLLGRLRGRTGPLLDRFLERLECWPGPDRSVAGSGELLFPVTACLPAVCQGLQRTIAGHDRPVRAVVLSPDGRTGVSCDDWRILVWDWASGVERLRIPVFDARQNLALTSLTLGPEADRVLAGANDGRLRVFDLATGTLSGQWPAHAPGDCLVGGAPKVSLLLSVGADQAVRVWTWDQWDRRELLFQSQQPPTAFALDPDRPVAVLGFADGGLAVWDLAHRSQLGGGKAPQKITALAIEAASEQVWWGDHEGRLGTWLYRRRDAETWPGRHRAAVAGLALCIGDRLISAGHDVAVRLWNRISGNPVEGWAAPTGPVVSTPVGHCYRVLALAACRDQPLFATASMDTTVRLWDADAVDKPPPRPGHRSIILDAMVDVSRRQALTVSKDGAIERWSLQDGRPLGTLGYHRPRADLSWRPGDPASPPWLCSRIVLAPDGRHAVTAGAGSLCWWSLEQAGPDDVHRIVLPADSVNDLVCSEGGAAFLLLDGDLYVGDAWRGPFERLRLGGPVRRLALARDRRTVALVTYQHGVMLGRWAGDHLENIRPLPHHAEPLAAAFLPDSQGVLTVGHDRCVRLWEVPSGKPLGIVGRHQREIWDLAVSSDGQTAATVGDDRWVALWDIPGRRLRACFCTEGPMIRLSMDPGAEFIATGDEAGRPVILRRLPSGS